LSIELRVAREARYGRFKDEESGDTFGAAAFSISCFARAWLAML
jgi:hypothetical protein